MHRTLSLRSQKLSNVGKGRSSNGGPKFISRAPPCFGRHVKLLALAAFVVVKTHSIPKEGTQSGRPVVKIYAESLSQHEKKHFVSTALNGIRVGELMMIIITAEIFTRYSQQLIRLYS
jgi:hypothetical protein